ncbi:MAG: outer membrane beta-barrel protein [Spirochaetia bacterium]
MRRIALFALLLTVLAPTAMVAQDESGAPGLAIAAFPIANIPILGASGVLGFGYGGHLSLWYTLGQLPLVADLTVSYSRTPAVNANATISTLAGSLGLLLRFEVIPRLAVRAGGRVSYGYSTLTLDGDQGSAGAIGWWGVAGLEYAFADAWSAALEIGATAHDNTYVGLETGIGIVFRPGGGRVAGTTRVRPERIRPEPMVEVAVDETTPDETTPDAAQERTEPRVAQETAENTRADLQLLSAGFDLVFPVFYRYYDANPIGSATLRNQTEQTISNIEIVVNIPRFMDVAQKQAVPDQLAAGEEVQIPLNILFNDGLLGVTEGTRVAGEFRVAYDIGGESQSYVVDAPLNVADRNAMTWDDDRKAASFVTAKDPTVLTFAKNVASVVRSVGYTTLNTPLRTGMAMLEAMALHGINYVIDPTSPYIE